MDATIGLAPVVLLAVRVFGKPTSTRQRCTVRNIGVSNSQYLPSATAAKMMSCGCGFEVIRNYPEFLFLELATRSTATIELHQIFLVWPPSCGLNPDAETIYLEFDTGSGHSVQASPASLALVLGQHFDRLGHRQHFRLPK